MKQYDVHLIFYAFSMKEGGNDAVKRLQRFVRRENLSIKGEKLTCSTCKLDLHKDDHPGMEQYPDLPYVLELGFEYRYHLIVSKSNPQQLHKLVVLLQAYADYIGIHSRLFHWKQ